jgi:hypothetical protein
MRKLLLFSLLLLVPLQAFALTNVTDCQTITSEGDYVMNRSINWTSEGTCFVLQSHNITFDCDGYPITLIGDHNAIFSNGYDNITVKNCDIYHNTTDSDWIVGVYSVNGDNITFYNNSFWTDNGLIGLQFETITNGNMSYNFINMSNAHSVSGSNAINVHTNSNNIKIHDNEIHSYGNFSTTFDVWLSSADNVEIYNNEFFTYNDTSNVIYSEYADNFTLYNNNVTVYSGRESEAFFLISGDNYNVSYNTIYNEGYFEGEGASIRLRDINNSQIHDNIVNNTGEKNVGVFVYDDTIGNYAYNTTIKNNDITTYGSEGRGIVSARVVNMIVDNNTCSMPNQENNGFAYGIYVWGTNDTIITNNVIDTNCYVCYGILFNIEDVEGAYNVNHTAINNTITTSYDYSHGIYDTWVDDMLVFNNTVLTTGYASRGIRFIDVENGNISYNSVTTTNESSHGLFLQQMTENYITNNIWLGYNFVNVTNSGSTPVYSVETVVWDGMYGKNFFVNNEIVDNGQTQLELYGYNNHTELIDQNINKYHFTNTLFSVENTTFGLVNFTTPVTVDGSGRDFGDDMVFGDNYVWVNGSTGLNTTANITLYGVGDRGFENPVILKDGQLCADCINYTSLTAENVKFSVTGFSNYSIGEMPEYCGDSICSTELGENCYTCALDCACSGDNICAWSTLLETFTCQGTYSNIGNQVNGFMQELVPVLIRVIIALGFVGAIAITINYMIRGSGKI